MMTDPFKSGRWVHRIGRAIGVAALLLGLSGAAAAPAFAQADPKAVHGGNVTLIIDEDIKSWDPIVWKRTYPNGPMDILDAVYGFIVYINADGVVVGGMAKSLTSTDATTWTLKLREGVKFTDGTPYDAAAVKYNWDRTADPATAAQSQAWVASWNKGITIVDPLTLTIKLPAPDANFGDLLADLAPFIASPAALKGVTDKTTIRPVGAGAFVLDTWDQGVGMTLKRNPAYWDQPRPYLDTLKFAIIPETNARIATVVQGGATVMAGYPYQFGNNAKAPGVAQFEIPIRGINRAYFNQTKGIFTDVRAREALYYAIDRNRLMQAFTQTDPATQGALYKAPVGYFDPKSPYDDAALGFPGFDPKKAQALIDQLAADGKPFNVKLVTYTNSDTNRLVAYVQQVLSTYKGVKATVAQVDQADFTPTCKTKMDFDVCFEGGIEGSNYPNIGKFFGTDGLLNWGRYSSAAMDSAIAEAAATVDPKGLKVAYGKVQQILSTDVPIYLFGEQHRFLLLRNTTGGIVNSNGGIMQKQYLYVCPGPCVK
jgi:peptide/nickel transport system substrate-binding protein